MAISSVGVSKLCADLPEAACGLFPGVWVLSHGKMGILRHAQEWKPLPWCHDIATPLHKENRHAK